MTLYLVQILPFIACGMHVLGILLSLRSFINKNKDVFIVSIEILLMKMYNYGV